MRFNVIPFLMFGGIGFLIGGVTGLVVGLVILGALNVIIEASR